MKQQGYRGYKLTLYDGPAADIPRAEAAREAVGDDFPLMLDAVAEYSFEQALEVGEALARLGYRWFEEPVPDRDIAALEQLTRRLEVPILATETVSLRELPQFLERRAIDMARGDVFIKAGITGPAQGGGHVRRGRHEPGDPRPALVAARHRQPARGLLGAQLRVLRAAPPDVPLRPQGRPPSTSTPDGCLHLPPGPGPRRGARLGPGSTTTQSSNSQGSRSNGSQRVGSLQPPYERLDIVENGAAHREERGERIGEHGHTVLRGAGEPAGMAKKSVRSVAAFAARMCR